MNWPPAPAEISTLHRVAAPTHVWHPLAVLAFAAMGFLLCLTQALGPSPDLYNYSDFFDVLRITGGGELLLQVSRFEAGFTLCAFAFTKVFSSNLALFAAMAFGSLVLKGWVLDRCCAAGWIFVAVAAYYLVRYFPLHEYTQIRVTLALGFLVLSAAAVWSGRLTVALLTCALAISFHTSAIAVIPALFVQPTRRWLAVTMATITFVLVRWKIGAAVDLLTPMTSLMIYQQQGFGEQDANPLSAALLLDWAVLAFALLNWHCLSLLSRKLLFLQMLSMAIFYGAIGYPVVAHRLHEMYAVFLIFLLADTLRLPKLRLPAAVFMLVSGAWHSYYFYFSDRFIS
jgi:hypothetical protein